MATNIKEAIIAASGTVSNAVYVGNDIIIGLEIPTITSAILYLQVSMEESGTYRRLLKTDGSGDWTVDTSTGNRFIFLDEAAPFNFIKVESSASQAAQRTFKFYYKGDGRPHHINF